MKHREPWHDTAFGKAARFLGGLQLAVPVLALTAAALAWGTWLDSKHNATLAKAMVYGSWWFIGLMGLVCVSLVFAVVTRYPWKKKHVGFITVHAGLILLIIAGFWSLFQRVEGHLMLSEGQTGDQIETEEPMLELAEFNAGRETVKGYAYLSNLLGSGEVVLKSPTPQPAEVMRVQVLERWGDSHEDQFVADGGPNVLRALEVALTPGATEGDWVAEENQSGPQSVAGLRFRVLPDGAAWTPPAGATAPGASGYVFQVGGKDYPLVDQGQEVFPGWKVVSVKRFEHALVGSGGLSESDSSPANPAAEVIISDGKGSSERHSAFMNFPTMPMGKQTEGTASSGAKFVARPAAAGGEEVVVFGSAASPSIGYVAPDGSSKVVDKVLFPTTLELGAHKVVFLRQFTRAHLATNLHRVDPPGKEPRPAIVVRVAGETEPRTIGWQDGVPVKGPGNLLLKFGRRRVQLPFAVTLEKFTKSDYPGTEMAMAYESDVLIAPSGSTQRTPFKIFMNNPYAQGPWKVYQASFGNQGGRMFSVFSVMRDPGIPLTYAASIILCVGIIVTFYSRSLSWGHPGIPAPGAMKEFAHASQGPVPPVAAADRRPQGAGV